MESIAVASTSEDMQREMWMDRYLNNGPQTVCRCLREDFLKRQDSLVNEWDGEMGVIAQNCKIIIHKHMFRTASPVFSSILMDLRKKMDFVPCPVVVEVEMEGDVMKVITHFLYTGDLQEMEGNLALKTLKRVIEFRVGNMLWSLTEKIKEMLRSCPTFALEVYLNAKTLCVTGLMEFALNMINEQLDLVVSSPEFLELSADNLRTILSADDLQCDEEGKLMEGSIKWAEHQVGKNEGRHDMMYFFGQVCTAIRVPLIDAEKLATLTNEKDLFDHDELVLLLNRAETNEENLKEKYCDRSRPRRQDPGHNDSGLGESFGNTTPPSPVTSTTEVTSSTGSSEEAQTQRDSTDGNSQDSLITLPETNELNTGSISLSDDGISQDSLITSPETNQFNSRSISFSDGAFQDSLITSPETNQLNPRSISFCITEDNTGNRPPIESETRNAAASPNITLANENEVGSTDQSSEGHAPGILIDIPEDCEDNTREERAPRASSETGNAFASPSATRGNEVHSTDQPLDGHTQGAPTQGSIPEDCEDNTGKERGVKRTHASSGTIEDINYDSDEDMFTPFKTVNNKTFNAYEDVKRYLSRKKFRLDDSDSIALEYKNVTLRNQYPPLDDKYKIVYTLVVNLTLAYVEKPCPARGADYDTLVEAAKPFMKFVAQFDPLRYVVGRNSGQMTINNFFKQYQKLDYVFNGVRFLKVDKTSSTIVHNYLECSQTILDNLSSCPHTLAVSNCQFSCDAFEKNGNHLRTLILYRVWGEYDLNGLLQRFPNLKTLICWKYVPTEWRKTKTMLTVPLHVNICQLDVTCLEKLALFKAKVSVSRENPWPTKVKHLSLDRCPAVRGTGNLSDLLEKIFPELETLTIEGDQESDNKCFATPDVVLAALELPRIQKIKIRSMNWDLGNTRNNRTLADFLKPLSILATRRPKNFTLLRNEGSDWRLEIFTGDSMYIDDNQEDYEIYELSHFFVSETIYHDYFLDLDNVYPMLKLGAENYVKI